MTTATMERKPSVTQNVDDADRIVRRERIIRARKWALGIIDTVPGLSDRQRNDVFDAFKPYLSDIAELDF